MNTGSQLYYGRSRRLTALALIAVSVLTLLALFGSEQIAGRAWGNLLVGAFFLVTVGLGGAVFVALTYISGAGWHVSFRRIPEAMARIIPFAGAVMLLVLLLQTDRYQWVHQGHGEVGTFWFKELWLTPSFWMMRAVVYVVIWSLLAGWLVARSTRQDSLSQGDMITGNIRLSALFLAVFAITFSLASVDWIMALEPMWFSTMWGVYNFAGMFQSALAVIILMCLAFSKRGGPLEGIFNDEHLHDLGRLLIGFSCFWMYIWFCQYMLIWYSNIPEETFYFETRVQGPWGPIVVVSILLNWVIPFFGLLPKSAKRSSIVMQRIAVVVLIGRWIDLYVMVFPSVIGEVPAFGVFEVLAICGLVAAGSLMLARSFVSRSYVPKRDPYLAESLHYHAG